jgi:hypothetical protein
MSRALLAAAALLCLVVPAAVRADAPIGRPQTGTAMKPVVCRVLEEGRGKTGAELASAIERDGALLARSNYDLAGLLPTDPPIACYRGRVAVGKLPAGAR